MSTHDKRELLKLKQGLIEDSDIIEKKERDENTKPEKLHGKKWLDNFVYHHKAAIFVVLFIAVMASFFIVEAVNKKRPDTDFLFVVSSEETVTFMSDYNFAVGAAVELFCPDFDDNGYVYALSYPVNLADNSGVDAIVSNQTKLFGEIQTGTTRIVLADRDSFDVIIGTEQSLDSVFVNLAELYHNNPAIEEDVLFKVHGSEFDQAFENSSGIIFPEDMYFALLGVNLEKDKAKKAHERALVVMENIVNGNYM